MNPKGLAKCQLPLQEIRPWQNIKKTKFCIRTKTCGGNNKMHYVNTCETNCSIQELSPHSNCNQALNSRSSTSGLSLTWRAQRDWVESWSIGGNGMGERVGPRWPVFFLISFEAWGPGRWGSSETTLPDGLFHILRCRGQSFTHRKAYWDKDTSNPPSLH